jgi:fructose-1,6-bisphosphatase/inositol monophosphatase family enzyme
VSRAAARGLVEGAEDSRLSLALRLAEEACRAAIAGQPTAVARWKGPGDRVTEVDLRIQVRRLADHEFAWIVDPLDGTNSAALGAVDLVLGHRATPWDLAAGAAVLLEAGGAITTPEGRPLFPFDVAGYEGQPVPFLAGNPRAHADASAACRAALVERATARPR